MTIPSNVETLVRNEIRAPVSALPDRVYFVSGKRLTKGSRQRYLKSRLEEAGYVSKEILEVKGSPEIPGRILRYLNDLPTKGFTKACRAHYQKAYSAAKKILQNDKHSGLYALTILRAIEEQPKPVYQARSKTQRLFAPHSLQMVNREVREPLVQDWISLDLRHAQLSICAKRWGCDNLQEFLESDDDFWAELLGHSNLPKSIVKKMLYAVVFGVGIQRRKKDQPSGLDKIIMESGLDLDTAVKKRIQFVSHPFMKELLKARRRRRKEIKKVGHIVDVFGTRLELDAKEGADEKSLMACEVQAIEMQLLWPAFELAEQNMKKFKIMLYAFDGIYITVHDRRRTDSWISKICTAVNRSAKKLGYATSLDVD